MIRRMARSIAAAVTLLACSLLSQSPTQISNVLPTNQKELLTPLVETPPTENGMPTNMSPTSKPEHQYTIVRLQPLQGNLETLLTQEVQKASQVGQQPFVEFDASW